MQWEQKGVIKKDGEMGHKVYLHLLTGPNVLQGREVAAKAEELPFFCSYQAHQSQLSCKKE